MLLIKIEGETERPIKIKNLDFFPYLRKVQLNNEDNEVRKQSEKEHEEDRKSVV